jgi:G3E family GTPase
MKDPLIARRFRLDGVITTVDAVNGARQLETQPESVKQAAMADRLLITKPDLTSEESLATLQAALGQLNPNAGILRAIHGEIDPNLLLDCGLYNPRSKSPDALRWLALAEQDHGVLHARGRHAAAIQTYCLSFAQPLPWPQYADAFRSLIDRHGERLLRLKGLLAVQDEPTPIAVHGVQHLLHPPVALDRWPDDERCSRLVLITNQLPLADVLDALAALRPQRYVKTAALRH